MPIMPTSYHAHNLFSLTMETRFGSTWRTDMEAPAIFALAEEIARGFGGRKINSPSDEGGGRGVWRFPDGSQAKTSAQGLEMAEPLDVHGEGMRRAAS